MSSFCSIPSKQYCHDLVFGYIRLTTLHTLVPSEISNICFLFYHDIIYWQFKGDSLKTFHDSSPNQQLTINQPQFTINNIPFQLTLIPKYTGYRPIDDEKFIRLSISCKESFPSNISNGGIYCVLFCDEMHYEFRHLWKIGKYRLNNRGWYPFGIKYKDIKERDIKQLNFGCYLEILHINYESNDDYNPSPTYFPLDISMKINCKYEWILNKDELNMFINCVDDYSLYSSNFNNDCFCIVTAPNGLRTLQCQGFVLQKLKLLKLPLNVTGILCDYELVLKADDNEELIFIRNEQRKYDYNDTGKNCKEDTLKLELFKDVKEIKFTVNVNVIKVYSGTESIEQDEWEKYGFV